MQQRASSARCGMQCILSKAALSPPLFTTARLLRSTRSVRGCSGCEVYSRCQVSVVGRDRGPRTMVSASLASPESREPSSLGVRVQKISQWIVTRMSSNVASSQIGSVSRRSNDIPTKRSTQLSLLLHRSFSLRGRNTSAIGNRRCVDNIVELIVLTSNI